MAKKVKKHFFKILPLSVAILMIFAFSIGLWQGLSVNDAQALAPGGSMSATTLLMKGNETKAINAITITDSGGEITAANDIRILIPATFVNTTWDSSDTTATIVNPANGVVSTTVSYGTTNYANDTLILDVTTNFNAGEAVTVSDLSFISANPGTNNSAVLLWAVDGASPTWSATSSATLTVDTVPPTVTDAKISISGNTGLGGPAAFRIGDTIKVTWDNSAGGDNNTDLASATANLSGWGGSATAVMTDTTACTGTNGDNIYEACYTITGSEGIDATGVYTAVTATDNAGNATTTGDTTYTPAGSTVDTIVPTITVPSTITLTDTTGEGIASVGENISYVAGTEGTGDGVSQWMVNLSAYSLGYQNPGLIAIVADNDDGAFSANENVMDDAGNASTNGAVTISGFTNIDNEIPVVTVAGTIGLTVDIFADGIASIGDQITYVAGTETTGDTVTWQADLSTYGLLPDQLPGAVTIVANNDDGAFSANENVKDDAGNTQAGAPTAITITGAFNIDNEAPNITVPGTITLSNDVGGDNIASIGDQITYAAGTDSTGDTAFWQTNLSAYGLSAAQAPGSVAIVANDDNNVAFSANESVRDDAFNFSGLATAVTISGFTNIDNVAPAAPSIPDLDATSDLGISPTDNITSDSTPQFNVTAEAGASVVVTSDVDGTIGTLPTATGGSDAIATTITTTAGQTGTAHNISATAIDTANNSGPASGTLAVTIDVTAPTLDTSSATNNSYYNLVFDGTIGEVWLTFTEAVNITYNDGDWDAVPGGLASFDVTGYTAGTGTTDIQLAATGSGTGVGATGTEPTLELLAGGNLDDDAGNLVLPFGPQSLYDYADPQVVSISPANGATSVSATGPVIINFTEPMDTVTGLTISDDDTNSYTLPATWTSGDTVATVSHVAWTTGVTITATVDAQEPNGGGLRDNTGANPYVWSFTTSAGGRSGGGGGGDINPPAAPTDIDLTADSTGTVTITWTDPADSDLSGIVIQRDHNPIVGTIVDAIYATVNKGEGTYSETGLSLGETYLYRVRAKDTSGNLSTNMEIYSITIPTQAGEIADEEVITAPTEPTAPAETLPTELILHDPEPAGPLPSGVAVGQLVKRPDMDAVYFIDQDNRRHAFPNEATFFSWYTDFSDVQTISAETLAAIPLGSNVTMRAGTQLLKITSDPKVYAVEPYGVIRWVQTEDIAKALYGADWASKVVDVDVSFFINYQVGSAIGDLTHPTGSLMSYLGETAIYYIDNAVRQLVSSEVFVNNLFQNRFVNRDIDQDITYSAGPDLQILPIEDLMMLK